MLNRTLPSPLTTDFEITQQFSAQLLSGEQVLWTGRPRQGVVFRTFDIFFIPFSLLWSGIALFGSGMMLRSQTPGPAKLFTIPFILVAAYITVGRFFTDALRRRKTVYAITNDRIMILSGVFFQTLSSHNIKALTDVDLRTRKNGSGTISIGASTFPFTMMRNMDWPGMRRGPMLDTIPDAAAVYSLIMELQRL